MADETIVLYQGNQQEPVKVRKIRRDVVAHGFPDCAWCKINPLRFLCENVQHGFAWDLIESVCYCDSCHLATIVYFEVPRDGEGGENETRYNKK